MSRVQLALNVPDLDEAIAFYSALFATEPNKRKAGYAYFVVADPPLKLVLFEQPGTSSRLNHLGIEVADRAAVATHRARIEREGLDAEDESGTCCFAEQEKVWVRDPDGPWEIYAVVRDTDGFGRPSIVVDDSTGTSLCCS